MPYNEEIDLRIKEAITNWKNTESKKMFGGVCFLLNGNMFCGVYKNYLILRLGEKVANKALENTHIKPFDITGKPMKGWIMVNEKRLT
jgi:TfoX/Sxy family transcriptional regulator of competence genes